MTTQNLWDEAKAVISGKFIEIQSYLKKQEKHQIDNLILHLKQLGKKRTKHPKTQRKERNHNNQSRKKCKRNERNNNRDLIKLKAGSLRR